MSQNFSLHEDLRDVEPTETGSNRAFGCIVGGVLIVIAAVKMFLAGAVAPTAILIFAAGAVLVVLGVVAPARLSTLNRLWLKLGAAMAKVVSPIILALLFFLVVTPTAIAVRLFGKRPLRLAPDRTAATYWIERQAADAATSNMKQQF